ncbi:MFS transporter [Streptosporangium sandarakinum]|uniref:MFS transporter n=1 Tax=Streptosporangium sandarakinum TaxID=1260955 RepID=UPI003716B671
MTTSMLPKSRQQLIIAVLMVCSPLIWLDDTVLSTTLETLADLVRGLNASPAGLRWATGSYTPAFATLMFTAGALGDRFGHRAVLATGLVVFAASSVWAAYAGDAGQPIAARTAMGVGIALIMPANLAILIWTFTGPARSPAIAVSSTSAGVGMAVGPVLAGVLLGHFLFVRVELRSKMPSFDPRLLALRSVRKPAAAGGAPEPARGGGPTADETAPRAGAEDLTAREGDYVGTR